ncbi:hypothetical protein J1N35_018270 [Gossypium stocksii]|uniref:Uncharacterized protein n=1 Tax=Gossypium stocksii TaxID=47602 RepID=A0A9D4A6I3_9ROSI|nr:hypothetical protein J1N35_018270 [Gossypium stocksii]
MVWVTPKSLILLYEATNATTILVFQFVSNSLTVPGVPIMNITQHKYLFMNFSRNTRCSKCKAEGPKRVATDDVQMKKKDWNCLGERPSLHLWAIHSASPLYPFFVSFACTCVLCLDVPFLFIQEKRFCGKVFNCIDIGGEGLAFIALVVPIQFLEYGILVNQEKPTTLDCGLRTICRRHIRTGSYLYECLWKALQQRIRMILINMQLTPKNTPKGLFYSGVCGKSAAKGYVLQGKTPLKVLFFSGVFGKNAAKGHVL